nr:hypothetical protein [Tanacetum cinerariifolium]
LLLIKAFKPSMNSDRWRISTRIQRSRTGTELLANLYANLGKQCLQGVLTESSASEHMAWQTDYCIMKEGMSILRGRKSVPGMNSSEREMERGHYSAFT